MDTEPLEVVPALDPRNAQLLDALPALVVRAVVAEKLATTERHIDRLVESGDLPCVKVGRLVRFDPRDVTAYIAAAKTGVVES